MGEWFSRRERKRRLAPVLAAAAFLALTGFGSGERLFAPSAEPWPRWQAHDPAATTPIDHAPWDRFLAAYLVVDPAGPNRLRYGAVTPADRKTLDAYIDGLAATPIDKRRQDQQMAYWVNLYNALTVQVVLDHYPVKSIRDIDISPGLFADGPWDKKLIEVAGEPLSLNDIEHRILRPIWRDARIHYAVNCASIGCPDLQPTAFRAEDLESQLDSAAKAYINDARGVRVRGAQVTVSKIYDWFIEDFGRNEAGVLRHLTRYAGPELAAQLKRVGKLTDVSYDWRLNDAE